MDPRLGLPSSDAWSHAAARVNAVPPCDWECYILSSVEQFCGGAQPQPTDENQIAQRTADFLLRRIVAWAPDDTAELEAALLQSGFDESHSSSVAQTWTAHRQRLVSAAREASTRLIATAGLVNDRHSSTSSYLSYEAAEIRVESAVARANTTLSETTKGLHDPVVRLRLPVMRPDDSNIDGIELSLNQEEVYALLNHIDEIQTSLDRLLGPASPP